MREVAYKDLELVRSWRDFLESPERFVKYLS
jgi:predicted ATPase